MKSLRLYGECIGFLLKNCPLRYGMFLFLSIFSMIKEVGILAVSYFGIRTFTEQNGTGNTETIFLILGFAGIVFGEMMNFLIDRLYNTLDYDLETKLYVKTLQNLSCINLLDMQNAETASRINDVFENGKDAVSILVFDFIYYLRIAAIILIYAAAGANLGAGYTAGALLLLGILSYVVYALKQKQEAELYDISRSSLLRQYRNQLFFQEKTHAEMLAGQCSRYFLESRKSAEQIYAQSVLKNKKYSSAINLACSFIIGIVFLLNIIYLYFQFANGNLKVEWMAAIITVTYLLYLEIQEFLDKAAMDKDAIFHAVNLWELFHMKKDYISQKECEINEIAVSKLGFCYKDFAALKEVSFTLHKNENVLLIGENGAGKTTLLNILSGLYMGYGGTISINHAIQENTLWLREYTAVVSQDYPVLNISLRENLFLQENIAEEEIYYALKKTGLYEKIMELPKKLDTVIGNLGDEFSFSRGQWQRFCIARLILKKKAQIWILDEATSALDAIAENQIFKLIKEEGKGKILIFVTHRLAAAREMNQILCLEHGEIKYAGTHKELYQSNEKYRERYDLQKEMYR